MCDVVQIRSIPEISAIYFALMQCGYEFQSMDRDPKLTECVSSFVSSAKANPFFAAVKQGNCEVYPYWPRAAMLETASFFVHPEEERFTDLNGLRNQIMSANNVTPAERDEAFWAWLEKFPKALNQVMHSDRFREYFRWENEWILEQITRWENDLCLLEKCVDACARRYGSPVRKVVIVLSPIKCIYSADYHLADDQFFFSSGAFRVRSVVHEFLHHVVHPIVGRNRHIILSSRIRYPDIDPSYYLDGGEHGQLNAFEEFFVRLLTERVMTDDMPEKLDPWLCEVVSKLNNKYFDHILEEKSYVSL